MAGEQLTYPEISKEGFVQLTSECYNTLFPHAVPKEQALQGAPIYWEEANSLDTEETIEHAVLRYLTVLFDDQRRLTICKNYSEEGDIAWLVNLYEPLYDENGADTLHSRVNISRTTGMSLQGFMMVAAREEYLGTLETGYFPIINALNDATQLDLGSPNNTRTP